MLRILFLIALLASSSQTGWAAEPALKLLFLGDQKSHKPAVRFGILAPVLASKGIELRYTEDVGVLKLETLRGYDGLILYANIDSIEPENAKALLDYVASGKGFIPLHCASYCFRNSPEVVGLIGAQFKQHGKGDVTTQLAPVDHPILDGFGGFASWDESYVHHLHNEAERIVLEYRPGDPQAKGNLKEPWTWIRLHDQGRVFYTAWGHDERTWNHPGFQNLVERGIRWACGQDPKRAGDFTPKPSVTTFKPPEMTKLPTEVLAFEYVDVGPKIPDYRTGKGQTKNLMQKPLDTVESMKHFVTPIDFEVQLFADETNFGGKPIAMNFDERGRLWVCETVDYPHDLSDDNHGRDRVRICEDTDGDGKADRFTIFAEGLSIPTAIAFHRGGAIVQNGSETLYLKDTDGDDQADLRQVLISNWMMRDTHGGVNNFRNGLDNWIWAMQGYNPSSPIIDGKEQQSFRMGFFRFKLSQSDPPKVEQFEFVRSTSNNTWGIGISEEGLIFGSTANRRPSYFMPIANRYYERVRGWAPGQLEMISDTHLFNAITDKLRQVDHHGGYTAGAGHAIYTARTYPPQWWNRTAFVCGPTGHLVGTFVLDRKGADFRSTNPFNLLASDDEWSAPIMAEVGPDGNVWVIDWYNYIVQHNPTPEGFETGKGNAYVTELRDKRFGRIYRVVYRGQEGQPTPLNTPLKASDMKGLLSGLSHSSMVVRLSAQRLLVERGTSDCVPELVKLVQDKSVDQVGLNVGAIHAIHTLAGLGALVGPTSEALQAVIVALEHPSSGVRLNAIRVLSDATLNSSEASKAILSGKGLQDSEPQVVLATLLAISDMNSVDASAVLAKFLTGPGVAEDPWIADAATAAAATHARNFVQALAAASMSGSLSDPALAIAARVAEHLARNSPHASMMNEHLAALSKADPKLASSIIEGWRIGWPSQHQIVISEAASHSLTTLFANAPDQSKADLIQLSSHWGTPALAQEMAKIAARLWGQIENQELDGEQRVAAADKLIAFDPASQETADRLLALIGPLAAPEIATGIVASLGNSTAEKTGSRLVETASKATPQVREKIVQTLLSRPNMTNMLLEGIERNQLSLNDLTTLQRQSLADHPDKAIKRAALKLLKSGGGFANPDREKIVREKMPLTLQAGNPEAGKLVFTKSCATCHVYQGEGKVVGPDLTGMSVHPKAELLTHILDPGRSVETNYRLYTLLTVDGLALSGILASESRTSVELIDAQAIRHTILREDIEQLSPSTKSAMPEGLETAIDDKGFVDLLEFLVQRGEYFSLPIQKAATASSAVGMLFRRDNPREALILDDWKPKMIEGIPFTVVDPQGGSVKNVVMLYGPQGPFAPTMPKSVMLPCESNATAIHILGGIAGWGAKNPGDRGVSMIVRLHYTNGDKEDHPLIDGQHIADYNGIYEVPKSKLAIEIKGRQIRYLSLQPARSDVIKFIELIKPEHNTAPIVMAITIQPIQKK